MTKPKKILLTCVAVAFVAAFVITIVTDWLRVREWKDVRGVDQLTAFLQRHFSGVPTDWTPDGVRVFSLMPFVAREFRWHWHDGQFIVETEVVFRRPW